MLEAGEHGNVRELAKAEKVNETYISRALRLTLLAPDIGEAIMDGRQTEGLTLPGLMEGGAVEWAAAMKLQSCRRYVSSHPARRGVQYPANL